MGCVNSKSVSPMAATEKKKQKSRSISPIAATASKGVDVPEINAESPKALKERSLMVATTLERLQEHKDYGLIKNLCSGRYGDVNLMEDVRNDRQVVVKIVASDKVKESETELWPQLKHQHILPLLEFLTLGDAGVFITEPMSGNLYGAVKTDRKFKMDPRALDQVKDWFRQIFCGMEYLQSQDLSHLNITSTNILISHTSTAVICDFKRMKKNTSQIRRWDVLLPLIYKPPETCQCEDCIERSERHFVISGNSCDSWAFGAMAVEVLTSFHLTKQIVDRTQCWCTEVYPSLFGILQEDNFTHLMGQAFPKSDLRNNEEVKLALDFIHGFLQLDQLTRIAPSVAAQHAFLERGTLSGPEPDVIWKQKVTMEASEFRAAHIKGFAETKGTKDVQVPKKKDDNTFIGDNVLQTTVDGRVQENTSRSEAVQIDKNKATRFQFSGYELDDGNNSFASSEKDEMDIVISELVSNITRDAFENLGQEYLFQNYNTYQITPEDIEFICKSTLESIEWPHLTKELILSRPIPSSPSSGSELGGVAKTCEKYVSEEITSQNQSHMIADEICQTIQPHDFVEAPKDSPNSLENDSETRRLGYSVVNECTGSFFNRTNENFKTFNNVSVIHQPSENKDIEENEVKPTKISSDFTSKSSASGSVHEHATSGRNTGHILRVAHFLRSKFIKARKFFRGDSKKEDSQKKKSST
ncbi:hypothetical protein JTE90_001313 [Oedothorax gibbosus]|uniref:non-specific serine/threonine protein kinase n=1 Tax=Oedothorax gibbosus TaxID=931172 RepID=A0AAV6TZN6_9ARAC|nr:hypothetical protein JTE90_001313 [Oedothorax gibbosus]